MSSYTAGTPADFPLRKAIVVSHERSGTHFLMNTLALNFGYISNPWVNLDIEKGINFYAPASLMVFFQKMHNKPIRHIMKSHHQAGFLVDCLGYLLKQFHVFYIYRDPRDVMASFWRHIRALPWDEGPKTATLSEFIHAAPRGGILRYQKEQAPTLLHRWRDHVEGWARLAEYTASSEIILVRYEDLNLRFDETVRRLGDVIGRTVDIPERPSKYTNVVAPALDQHDECQPLFSTEDYDFLHTILEDTMQRLGIPWEVEQE